MGARTTTRLKRMPTALIYARMIVELLIALFVVGLFAAATGGAAYGLSKLAGF
jgi:hypothetical protein